MENVEIDEYRFGRSLVTWGLASCAGIALTSEETAISGLYHLHAGNFDNKRSYEEMIKKFVDEYFREIESSRLEGILAHVIGGNVCLAYEMKDPVTKNNEIVSDKYRNGDLAAKALEDLGIRVKRYPEESQMLKSITVIDGSVRMTQYPDPTGTFSTKKPTITIDEFLAR